MISGSIHVIFTGKCVNQAARDFAFQTGFSVKAVESGRRYAHCSEIIQEKIRRIINELSPSVLFVAHSSQGLETAAVLSVHLGAYCVAGVEAVCMEQDRIVFSRSLFGGRLVAHEYLKKHPAVVTIQPGSFSYVQSQVISPGSVEYFNLSVGSGRIRSLGIIPPAYDNTDLSQAKIVVVAGRGVGSRENMKMIEELAACFPGSAIGGSRIACDLGWLDHGRQVGITGTTVSPLLYIACGISGSSQHIAGMKGSVHIVAINKDPDAPICQIADVCVIDDLCAFIPELTGRLKCLP